MRHHCKGITGPGISLHDMLIMKCMYDPARNWLYVAVTIPTMNDGANIDKEKHIQYLDWYLHGTDYGYYIQT